MLLLLGCELDPAPALRPGAGGIEPVLPLGFPSVAAALK